MARTRGLPDAVVALGSAGTITTALLAADDLISSSSDLPTLGPALASGTAAVVVAACLLTIVGARVLGDHARALIALATADLLTRASATLVAPSWPPLLVLVHAIVPMAFGAAAVRWCRGSSSRTVRLVALVAVGTAVVWLVAGAVPVSHRLSVGAQVVALVSTSALGARPLLRWSCSAVRSLWASAEVR